MIRVATAKSDLLATTEFCEAVAYALSCVHREGLVLKPKQEEAFIHLYAGRDVFAWFPTGYGKSLCYQLLPFMFDYKLKRTNSPVAERSVVFSTSVSDDRPDFRPTEKRCLRCNTLWKQR